MRSAETVDTRTDAAACRLRKLLNEGMLALVAGLGCREGWLDALVAAQPASAATVARATRGADEARVRAWLAALVAGRRVDDDGARDTSALTPDLTDFLASAEGKAYLCGLVHLGRLASSFANESPLAESWPPARELAALVPGMTERLASGAAVLELDERALEDADAPARLAAGLAPGAVAVIAVPALSGSPADDALLPLGAFLLGGRALSLPMAGGADAHALGTRLAGAGLVVRGLARVPSDPFRNYLIARKPDSTNQ